jgi:5-hydroxyisourate hydrolase
MGLSTHVLDTMHGCPAAGMQVALYTTQGEQANMVKSFTLNSDGRNPDGLLYDNASLRAGTYRLVFDVSGYFKAKGIELPEPNFLNRVSLDFGVAKVDEHYHVPLLVSPWSYSTYRGS